MYIKHVLITHIQPKEERREKIKQRMGVHTFIRTSSLSSCRAISTDIPDPLSQPLSIVRHFRLVLRATYRIYTELLYVGSNWSLCFYSAMWRDPQEYITYEFVHTSPAVSRISGLSNFDSFRDER